MFKTFYHGRTEVANAVSVSSSPPYADKSYTRKIYQQEERLPQAVPGFL